MNATGSSNSSIRRTRVILWILAALALLYLIIEHPAHLLGWLPFLVIMACPQMHIFMHRGHRRGAHESHSQENSNP